jgi:hypothetical protein
MKHKKLAEQAGIGYLYEYEMKWAWLGELEVFAELVRADERQGCAEDYTKIMRDAVAREREACAKLCDARGELHGGLFGSWAQDISERIRARGEK